MNQHKNFAYGAVATAPSPAASGVTLVLTAGHGARMPSVPFEATVWPSGAVPDPTNAEVVKVTGVSTDTLTIVRAREGSAARTVVVGDQFAATITEKDLNEPTVRDAPAEDVYVPAGYAYLAGSQVDCATNDITVVIDGEVLFV